MLGVSTVLLGGCLPPVLQVASWTVSGASYVFSGKGVGDHVLSLASEKDCATWRVLQGKRICVDHEKDFENSWDAVASTFKVPAADQSKTSWDANSETGEAVAEMTVWPAETTVQVATAKVDEAPPAPVNSPTSVTLVSVDPASEDELFFGDEAEVQANAQASLVVKETPKNAPVLLAGADNTGDLAPASGPLISEEVEKEVADKPLVTYAHVERRVDAKPGIYLVIGSFRSNNRAEILQSKHTTLETAIMKASVSGRSLFRVLAGPIERPGLASARKVLSNAGVRNSWAMRLCKATLTPPPCALPLQQAALPK